MKIRKLNDDWNYRMKDVMMRFELGDEALELVYDNDGGMFEVVLGSTVGETMTMTMVGTHCERAMGIYMFNHEALAMQSKWEKDT